MYTRYLLWRHPGYSLVSVPLKYPRLFEIKHTYSPIYFAWMAVSLQGKGGAKIEVFCYSDTKKSIFLGPCGFTEELSKSLGGDNWTASQQLMSQVIIVQIHHFV